MPERRNNFINGTWVSAESCSVNVNPSDTSDIIGEYAEATEQNVEDAAIAAQAAFRRWSKSPAIERANLLIKVARELDDRQVELGELLSREEGKVRGDGINEVAKAAKVFEYFAAEILRPDGDHFPSVREGIDVEAIREPVGVIAVVTPWNLPIGTPSWKIAAALAFGNCVLFKPSNLVPACAWALADIIDRAGFPPGVFNCVMGSGSKVGEFVTASRHIDAITFTGSNGVGERLAKRAAERRLKLQMEMGGKNPLVVLDDADLDNAVDCAVKGAFYATGQRCTASSRLIVTRSAYGKFIRLLVDRMRRLRIGHALAAGVDIGPVASDAQLRQNFNYVDLGQKEGARLAIGGDPLERDTPGYYMSPALFVDTTNAMRINRDEIFGPIASAIEVRDYEEALAVANDTPYGLAGGICTSSMKHAQHFKRHAEVGICMVNLPTAGSDFHAPFGGRKQSSYGSRELSSYAREFYTTVKTVYSATPS
ncbi:MAG: aldehyde dehydrogenase family protein [Parvibaculaceae bacterium]